MNENSEETTSNLTPQLQKAWPFPSTTTLLFFLKGQPTEWRRRGGYLREEGRMADPIFGFSEGGKAHMSNLKGGIFFTRLPHEEKKTNFRQQISSFNWARYLHWPRNEAYFFGGEKKLGKGLEVEQEKMGGCFWRQFLPWPFLLGGSEKKGEKVLSKSETFFSSGCHGKGLLPLVPKGI